MSKRRGKNGKIIWLNGWLQNKQHMATYYTIRITVVIVFHFSVHASKDIVAARQ
jgi:hypothetical protein